MGCPSAAAVGPFASAPNALRRRSAWSPGSFLGCSATPTVPPGWACREACDDKTSARNVLRRLSPPVWAGKPMTGSPSFQAPAVAGVARRPRRAVQFPLVIPPPRPGILTARLCRPAVAPADRGLVGCCSGERADLPDRRLWLPPATAQHDGLEVASCLPRQPCPRRSWGLLAPRCRPGTPSSGHPGRRASVATPGVARREGFRILAGSGRQGSETLQVDEMWVPRGRGKQVRGWYDDGGLNDGGPDSGSGEPGPRPRAIWRGSEVVPEPNGPVGPR